MLFVHIFMALIFALIFTAIVVGGFRQRGPWASLAMFFIVLFLATWAGGIWIHPIGRPLWGTYWLPFLAVGLIVALLLAAVAPIEGEESTVKLIDQKKREKEKRRVMGVLGGFFWALIIVLIAAIIARYIIDGTGWIS